VRDADDAVRQSEKVKGDQVLLRVWSSSGETGGARYVTVATRKK